MLGPGAQKLLGCYTWGAQASIGTLLYLLLTLTYTALLTAVPLPGQLHVRC